MKCIARIHGEECGGDIRDDGFAIVKTVLMAPDFLGEKRVILHPITGGVLEGELPDDGGRGRTVSHSGPPIRVRCKKCSKCGHSFTVEDPKSTDEFKKGCFS